MQGQRRPSPRSYRNVEEMDGYYDYPRAYNQGYPFAGYPRYMGNPVSTYDERGVPPEKKGEWPRKSSQRLLIIFIVIVAAGLAALIIGLGLGLGLKDDDPDQVTSRLESMQEGIEPDFTASVIVDGIEWDERMADTDSSTFKKNAHSIETSMDTYYIATTMAEIYDHAIVTRLWQGSVGCDVEIYLIPPTDNTDSEVRDIYNEVQNGSGQNELMEKLSQGQTTVLGKQQNDSQNQQDTVKFRFSTFMAVVTPTTTPKPVTTIADQTSASAEGTATVSNGNNEGTTTTPPESSVSNGSNQGTTTTSPESTVSNGNNEGTTTTLPESTTAENPVSSRNVEMALGMELYVTNTQWNETLGDKASYLFETLANSLIAELDDMIVRLGYNKTVIEVISFNREDGRVLGMIVVGMSALERADLGNLTESIRSILQPPSGGSSTLEVKTVEWAREFTVALNGDEAWTWHNNRWYSLCYYSLPENAADIFCLDIGYKHGQLYEGEYKSEALSVSLVCNASDFDRNNLTGCSYDDVRVIPIECSVARVTCFNEFPTYSFSGGEQNGGGVKVNLNNREGFLCASGDISQSATKPLCRNIDPSYYGGILRKITTEQIPRNADIWRVEAYCYSDELDELFTDCVRSGWEFLRSNEYYTTPNTATSSTTSAPNTSTTTSSGNALTSPSSYVDFYTCLVDLYCFPMPFALHRGPVSLGFIYDTDRRLPAAFCRDSFGDSEANAACRDLGFPGGGTSLDYNPFPFSRSVDPDYSTFNYQCSGSETLLETCTKAEGGSAAICSGPAVVKCAANSTSHSDFDISIDSDGWTVLVYFDGEWGTICDVGGSHPWTEIEATAVCQQLGFDGGSPRSIHVVREVPHPHLLRKVECPAKSSRLTDCSHEKVNDDGCVDSFPAEVYCFNFTQVAKFELVPGSLPNNGLVKVTFEEQEGYLCTSDFDDVVTSVMCRSLGFTSGTRDYDPQIIDANFSVIWNTEFDGVCTADDRIVETCRLSPWVSYSLNINDEEIEKVCQDGYVYLQCYGQVRISEELNKQAGPLLIFDNDSDHYDGICHGDLTQAGANAACREVHGSTTMKAEILNPWTYVIVDLNLRSTANITCGADAQLLSDCITLTGLSSQCASASILCYEGDKPPGETPSSATGWRIRKGFVEVQAYDIWGTVCFKEWTNKSAMALCSSLNASYTVAYAERDYRPSFSPVWLSEISCSSGKQDFNMCTKTVLSETTGNCQFNEVAKAYCFMGQKDIPNLMLKDEGMHAFYVKGHPVVTKNDKTGYVCNDADSELDDSDIESMCNKMGYLGGKLSEVPSAKFELDAVWSGEISCSPNGNICQFIGEFSSGRDIAAIADAGNTPGTSGPICADPVPTLLCFSSKVRLDEPEQSSGILLISNGFRWYGLCASGFSEALANKFCIEAGYTSGSYSSVPATFWGASSAYEEMQCGSDTLKFEDCEFFNNREFCNVIVFIDCFDSS